MGHPHHIFLYLYTLYNVVLHCNLKRFCNEKRYKWNTLQICIVRADVHVCMTLDKILYFWFKYV